MPEHNRGMPVVPQILTDRAERFLFSGGERPLKEITKARCISEYKVAAGEALRRWEENCCMDN